MKRTAWNLGMFLGSFLAVASIVGCGGGSDVKDTDSKGGAAAAITTEDKFNAPPGADPSVPAEMGGAGFEKIAADSGWQTADISPDQFKYIADQNAKKGGSFTMAVTEFPATFRAYGKDENDAITRMIHGMVYEPLITINPLTLDFLPVLASHWKVDADGQTYWFRLDPNARFSDGHPVTTEDVIATYKLGVDSTILSPYTNSFFQSFDPPEVISKYIFKVRSKEKNWKNMLYFGGTEILPAHIIGGMSGSDYLSKFQYDMPPGSGPYILQPSDVVKQKAITMTRRANWWGGNYDINRGQNNFDKITMLVVHDERLQLEKFKKGEVDFYVIARAQWWNEEFDFGEIKRGLIQKRKIYNDNPVGIGGFVFNMRKAPFDDPKVREAFIHLFNREQLLEKLMFNQYTMTDSYYPNSVYENPNNPKYRYDPEKAAQLLAEAGYTKRNTEGILVNEKTGKPFEIEMAIVPELERIVTPVQQDLKQAGIKLTLRNIDGPSNFKLMNERNFTIAWINWGGLLYPNPISSFSSKLADVPNTNNLAGFKNQRADEIMEKEQVTFDQAARVKMLRELDSILMDSKQYALSWYAPYTRLAYWNKFGVPDFHLGKISDWRGVLSSWWYDADKAQQLAEARKDQAKTMPVGDVEVKFWPEYDKQHQNAPALTSK